MPDGVSTLVGALAGAASALVGAAIALVTTWLIQRTQRVLEQKKITETRVQLVYKETSDKVYQLAVDLSAASYLFLWLTWCAKHDDLDEKTLERYWADIQKIMPRLYGDYVALAALDDEIGSVAGRLVDKADDLEVAISKAAPQFNKQARRQLTLLRPKALRFADDVSDDLAGVMKTKRLKTISAVDYRNV